MTIEGFTPIYRPTTVSPNAPPRSTLPASASAAVPESPAAVRDRADAARLFDAVGRGSVDGYHQACRAASRPNPACLSGAVSRDRDGVERLLNDAHRLLGRTDGDLLTHAASARPGHGKEACIALLVRDGMATGARDAGGHTAAMRLAAHRRDAPSLAKLVPHMSTADLDRTNVRDRRRSALHYAIRAGNLQAVKLLIEAGANVNLACGDRSPVAMARRAGHDEIVRCLQRAGGMDVASVAGARIRPSWSLASLVPDRAPKARPPAASARLDGARTADEFGTWDDAELDCLQLLTPDSVRRVTVDTASRLKGR